MNRISKQLLKIAREVKALDEQGDGSGFQMWHEHENAEQERLDIAQKQRKKYILHHKVHGLWRIQACKNFSNVKKGDFGGLIKSEENLSHDGNCWVYGNAKVFDKAKVYGDTKIYENAQVFGNAHISGNAKVFGYAIVHGDAFIAEDARFLVSRKFLVKHRFMRMHRLLAEQKGVGTGKENRS